MTPKIGALIKNSKTYYQNLKPITSPALKQSVVFNRYGWKHLIYDSQDHRRNNKEIKKKQKTRLGGGFVVLVFPA